MFRNNDISDGGRPVLISPPDYAGSPVLSLAALKSALGIVGTTQDVILQGALDAAIAALDPASNGWLGRAIGVQTWELQLRSFNDRRTATRPHYNPLAIPLPYPTLISIASVKYLDSSGNDTTLVQGTDYRILGGGEMFGRQAIAPLYSKSWPVARDDDASVRIRYSCGYDGTGNRVVPKQLITALCLSVRALMPVLQRDGMLMEQRVDGVGWKRFQTNPEFAQVTQSVAAGLLVNLSST